MAYIYIDESWDLGFDFGKNRTSKYFVITFLFSKNKEITDNTIKKFFQWLKWKKIKIKSWIFHSFKESPQTISKLLKLLSEKDIKIMSLILDKQKSYLYLHESKHFIYNRVVNILIDMIISNKLLPNNEKIIFIASRRETSKTLNENFLSYLEHKHIDRPNIEFHIETPQEKWLQLADCVCYSIYQKYEHNNKIYYDIINSKIIVEKIILN